MDAEVSTALRDFRDEILKEMRAGFSGVHKRQDVTNGRIGKAEMELARQDERIKTMRVHARHDDSATNGDGDGPSRGGDRRVSERDVRMVLAGIGGAGGAFMFVWKILPLFLKAIDK